MSCKLGKRWLQRNRKTRQHEHARQKRKGKTRGETGTGWKNDDPPARQARRLRAEQWQRHRCLQASVSAPEETFMVVTVFFFLLFAACVARLCSTKKKEKEKKRKKVKKNTRKREHLCNYLIKVQEKGRRGLVFALHHGRKLVVIHRAAAVRVDGRNHRLCLLRRQLLSQPSSKKKR